MKVVEKAYIAGLIDGEGYVGIAKNFKRRRYHLVINVVTYDKEIPEFIYSHFGGNLIRVRGALKNYWRWGTYDKNAKRFLEQIKPFLVLKKRQAELGIEFATMLRTKGGSAPGRNGQSPLSEGEIIQRDMMYQQMKEMNTYDAHC